MDALLAGAIFLYTLLPFMGLAVWHRVIPEHDHLSIEISRHAPSEFSDDHVLSTIHDNSFANNSARFSINRLHLPNFTGLASLFVLVLDLHSPFAIVIPPARAEHIATVTLRASVFYIFPPDPPPTV